MALLLERMNDGEIALGFGLGLPAAAIIEHACGGWDWLWIDGQHGQHDYRSMLECVRAADACDIAPIVRVPGHDYGTIGRVLDMRPAGIMVPMIDTAEDARAVVDAVRFPPLGKRSYGGRRSIDVKDGDTLTRLMRSYCWWRRSKRPKRCATPGPLLQPRGSMCCFLARTT